MQRIAPPFRADHVGSLLRPAKLKEARERHARGDIDAAELRAVEDAAIVEAVRRQEEIGLRSVTDGEYRRAMWHFDFLERLAPRNHPYRHNDFDVRTVNMTPDESPNGHAHCLQLALGASQTIPIKDGRLTLGQWQRIFMVELDRARPREAVIQTFGVARPPTPVGLRRNGSRTRGREV